MYMSIYMSIYMYNTVSTLYHCENITHGLTRCHGSGWHHRFLYSFEYLAECYIRAFGDLLLL